MHRVYIVYYEWVREGESKGRTYEVIIRIMALWCVKRV